MSEYFDLSLRDLDFHCFIVQLQNWLSLKNWNVSDVWARPTTCNQPIYFPNRTILQSEGDHLLQRHQDLLATAQTYPPCSLPSLPAGHRVLLPHLEEDDQVPQYPASSPNLDHPEGAQHPLGALPSGLARRPDCLWVYRAALFKSGTLRSVLGLVDADLLWLLCHQHRLPSSLSQVRGKMSIFSTTYFWHFVRTLPLSS